MSENISKTIGIEYELLVWDNRYEKKGICEAYNRTAARAKYPYLCFLHEDILFDTTNWGGILSGLFASQPEVGVIGIAGSAYKSAMFSGWFTSTRGFDYYNITHRVNGVDHPWRQPGAGERGVHPVVCIDGVFIACRKEVWAGTPFDADQLNGFHFYDIDFSVRAARKCQVIVTMDIHLFHITQLGDYGNSWVETAMLYHTANAGLFPFFLDSSLPPQQVKQVELQVARSWLDRLKNEKISLKNRIRWIHRQRLHRQFLSLWYPILRFLVFKPLKLYKVQRLIKRNPSSN